MDHVTAKNDQPHMLQSGATQLRKLYTQVQSLFSETRETSSMSWTPSPKPIETTPASHHTKEQSPTIRVSCVMKPKTSGKHQALPQRWHWKTRSKETAKNSWNYSKEVARSNWQQVVFAPCQVTFCNFPQSLNKHLETELPNSWRRSY